MSKTKLPAIPAVPNTLTAQEKSFLTAVKETVEVREGVRGDPLDKFVSFRDLSEGLNATIETDPTTGQPTVTDLDTSGDGSTSTGTTTTYNPATDYSPPPEVGTVVTSGLFSEIILTWPSKADTYQNHAYTEVWRHTADVFDMTLWTFVGTSRSDIFVDNCGEGRTYYYWARHVTQAGVNGTFAQHGVLGATSVAVATLIDTLVANFGGSLQQYVLDAPVVVSGVTIPAGVYTRDLYAANARIGNLAVSNAQITNLDASKIRAGTLTAGESITVGSGPSRIIIDSYGNIRTGSASAYATGTGFWIGDNAGTASFFFGNSLAEFVSYNGTNLRIETPQFKLQNGNATFSGTLTAPTINGGTINGTTINASTMNAITVNTSGINGGAYTGFAWPAAGSYGFHLGPGGLLLGNYNGGNYAYIYQDGRFSFINNGRGIYSDGTNVILAGNIVATANITDDAITTGKVLNDAITKTGTSANPTSLLTGGFTYSDLQSVTITTVGRPFIIWFSCKATFTLLSVGTGYGEYRILANGVQVGAATKQALTGGTGGTAEEDFTMFYAYQPPAGVIDIVVQHRCANGQLGSSERVLFVMEVKR